MVKEVIVRYRDKKPKDGQQAWWSEKQKYEAVAAYVLLGNIMDVFRLTGIPEITLRRWKAQPWWPEAEREVRMSSKLQLSGKLTKAISLANIALEDRLVNGDFQYDPKTGTMLRKPVSADTAVKVLDKLIDRQEQLDKSARSLDVVTQEGVAERLEKLAKDFMKFANSKTIEGTANVILEETDQQVTREDGEPETTGTSSGEYIPAEAGSDLQQDPRTTTTNEDKSAD